MHKKGQTILPGCTFIIPPIGNEISGDKYTEVRVEAVFRMRRTLTTSQKARKRVKDFRQIGHATRRQTESDVKIHNPSKFFSAIQSYSHC